MRLAIGKISNFPGSFCTFSTLFYDSCSKRRTRRRITETRERRDRFTRFKKGTRIPTHIVPVVSETMTAVVAETDQGKAAKEPPAKPGKEETGNGTKPTPEVMWAWEQGLPRPEQLPGTNSQLLTPSLANAFGIQMMNGYRYPLPPPSQESGERTNGESRAPGSYHDPMGAAQMQASMPPPYGNFHHSMPPPGSANAQAAAAAAMASAAMASYGGFPGMYQAPFGAQRPGGHYDHYGRPLSQGGDRGMGPSQGASSITQDPNLTLNPTHLDRRPRVAIERRRRVRSTPRPRSGYYKYPSSPSSRIRSLTYRRSSARAAGHMDPNVSYEHMMAYQAGMEHSRSFDAFKRSREDPGMSMGMEGAYPTLKISKLTKYLPVSV